MANNKEKITESTSHFSTLKPADFSLVESGIHPSAFSVYIRALLQNWRQGTVGAKGRSDVRYTGKKPWKQKGTGRARAGDARSPLWRGGGVVFGPQMRTKKLHVPKDIKKQVFNKLFFDFAKNEKIISLDWVAEQMPKTNRAFAALKNAQLAHEKIVLFLSANDALSYASFVNIPNVQILFFDQPNAFALSHADYWVVLNKDMDSFTKMVEQWN